MTPLLGLALAAFSINPIVDVQDIFSNDFMQYAFLAGTSMAILSGLAGYFVVLRQLTFAGEALSHVAFAAALAGLLLGIDPLAGMLVITLASALGIGVMSRSSGSHDVAIGTVMAWILGLGALFLSVYSSSTVAQGNGQVGINVLFGSIFGVQLPQARATVIAGTGAIVVLLAIARPLLFASLDPAVAQARGVPIRLLGYLLLATLAITVAEAVQVVGALLVLALLVLPAAIAQRLIARPFAALGFSALLAVAFTWAGLVIGFYTPYPVSFLISSLAFCSYLLVRGLAALQSGRSNRTASSADLPLTFRS